MNSRTQFKGYPKSNDTSAVAAHPYSLSSLEPLDSQLCRGKSLSDDDVRVVQQLRSDLRSISRRVNNFAPKEISDNNFSDFSQCTSNHYPVDLMRKMRRMNLTGFGVGETVLVRCSANKWQHAEVLKVTEEGVRLWVGSARTAVEVPVQLLHTHLTKLSVPFRPPNCSVSNGYSEAESQVSSRVPGCTPPMTPHEPQDPKPPSYVKSQVHAVRPAHLSHRQLYQHVPVEDNCGFCNSPMTKGSVLASWSCGHKTHFACVENRFRIGLMSCALCQDDEPQKKTDPDSHFTNRERTLSGGSSGSNSSFGNSTFGDSANTSCARSESCGSSVFDESSAVPNFLCVCGHSCSMTNMEEPMAGQLRCPICQYNPWRPSKNVLISQCSQDNGVNVLPNSRPNYKTTTKEEKQYTPPVIPRKTEAYISAYEQGYCDHSHPVNQRAHEPREFIVRDRPFMHWVDIEGSPYNNINVVPRGTLDTVSRGTHLNSVPRRNFGMDRGLVESSFGMEDMVAYRMDPAHPVRGPRLRRTRSLCDEEELGPDYWGNTSDLNSYDNFSISSPVSSEAFDCAHNSHDSRNSFDHHHCIGQATDHSFLEISPQQENHYFSDERLTAPRETVHTEGYTCRLVTAKSAGFDGDNYGMRSGMESKNILSWSTDAPWISVIKDGQDLCQRDVYSGTIPPF